MGGIQFGLRLVRLGHRRMKCSTSRKTFKRVVVVVGRGIMGIPAIHIEALLGTSNVNNHVNNVDN